MSTGQPFFPKAPPFFSPGFTSSTRSPSFSSLASVRYGPSTTRSPSFKPSSTSTSVSEEIPVRTRRDAETDHFVKAVKGARFIYLAKVKLFFANEKEA